MDGDVTFYRPQERARERRTLPAATYNLAHTLLRHAPGDCLFVPIRSMQYLAVVDDVEFVFVDREVRHLMALAWQGFRPQARNALHEPVPYEVVVYHRDGLEIMARLQGEFHKALELLQKRQPAPVTDGAAPVVPLAPRRR